MNKKISPIIAFSIIIVIAGIAGTAIFLFSQDVKDDFLPYEKTTEEIEGIENDESVTDKSKEEKEKEGMGEDTGAGIDENELKERLQATEIVSYNLAGDSSLWSVEFWTEATCPFEGGDYEYKIPTGFAFNGCEEGKRGSHGGCPTCKMSKIELLDCPYNYCSLEEYIETFDDFKGLLNEKIEGYIQKEIYIDTGFNIEFVAQQFIDEEHKQQFKSTVDVLNYFFEKIDIDKLVNGNYLKKDIEQKIIFDGQTFKIGHDIKITTGELDPEYGGKTAIITFSSFDHSLNFIFNSYALIVNCNGDKKLLLGFPSHKIWAGIKNEIIKVGDKVFFEGYFGGAGGSCVGAGEEKFLCRLKDMNFFCYKVGQKETRPGIAEGCGAGGQFQIEYDVKDINNNGENEVIISLIFEYNKRSKKVKENIYSLNQDDELVLINSKSFR